MKKNLLVFASGDKEGGGSGFQELAENSRTGVLDANVAAVVSNHEDGGVKARAEKLGISFEHFPLPREAGHYQAFVRKYNADFTALSGWLKMVYGLDPAKTINIHPALLPVSAGTYSHFAHEKMIEEYKAGRTMITAVTMHFVTEKYDDGPIFFQYPVLIRPDDTPETLRARTNKIEHAYQSWATNLVVQGQIWWDGKNRESLTVPDWYNFLPDRISAILPEFT